jgi:hypothetical protein
VILVIQAHGLLLATVALAQFIVMQIDIEKSIATNAMVQETVIITIIQILCKIAEQQAIPVFLLA